MCILLRVLRIYWGPLLRPGPVHCRHFGSAVALCYMSTLSFYLSIYLSISDTYPSLSPYIYIYEPACSSGERSKFTAQMRPVATAVASGSLTSLAFSLARDILRGPLELSIPPPSFPPLTSELCTFIRPQPDWHLDFYSVLVGIFVGLSLNVFVDLLIVLRIRWTRFLQVRLATEGAATRPLYRVLA